MSCPRNFRNFPGILSPEFQKLMVDQLKERCKSEGVSLNVVEMNNRSHKKERIASLHSITATGGLRFNKNHRLLIEQLCSFPLCDHDDAPDALEMAVRIAEQKSKKVTATY